MKSLRRFLPILLPIAVFILFITAFLVKNHFRTSAPIRTQTEFNAFLDEMFCRELSGDALYRQYLIQNPDSIRQFLGSSDPCLLLPVPEAPSIGSFNEAEHQEQVIQQTELLENIKEFNPEHLTPEQVLTRSSLLWSLEASLLEGAYPQFRNPVSPYRGIQVQLPLLLSEFRLETQADIALYFALLDSVFDSFDSLLLETHEKFRSGSLPTEAARLAAEQCADFLNTPIEENPLLISFSDRLSSMGYLTEVELATYEMKNRYRVETSVIPAYAKLLEMLTESAEQTKSNPSSGLSGKPDGREYYASLARTAASSDLTVPEMKTLLESYLKGSLENCKRLVTEHPDLPQLAEDTEVGGRFPDNTIRELRTFANELLPILSDMDGLQVTVKELPEALSDMTGPALYLVPPLDSYLENTVYINPAYPDSELYSLLAHEAFPGHLCARVCSLAGNPHPIRCLTDYIGWEEGWASYVELSAMSCYPFSPSDVNKSSSTSVSLSQANNPVLSDSPVSPAAKQALSEYLASSSLSLLCLYGLTDIGIHYDGWSRTDTIRFWEKYGIPEEGALELWELVLCEPGYYLPYSVGCLQVLELREKVREQRGEQYTESTFCSELLALGPLSFSLCEEYLLTSVTE